MKSTALKGVFGAAATILIKSLGGWDASLAALVTLITADYITGVLAAIYHKSINSDIGARGIIKKVFYMAVVMVAQVVDSTVNLGGWVRDMTIFFFVANESISILENAGSCGLPIPKFLLEKLEQLKQSSDKSE